MDLSGTWRAAVADDDLRRSAFALDLRPELPKITAVTLIVRGDSLEKSMSQYLIEQLHRKSNIAVQLQSGRSMATRT